MLKKYICLLNANAEIAGGGGAAKTVEPKTSPLEAAISKVFPEESEAAPAAPEKKEAPKTGEQTQPDETVDLSQPAKPAPNGEETPEQKQQREAEELAEAKEAGLPVEEYRTAKAAEQKRLDDIAAKTGETPEQISARDEKDGKLTDLEAAKPGEKKTFTQEEMEAMIQKRVKNLAAENEKLKAELAAKPVVAPANSPLDAITDPAKLAEAESTAQSGLEQADDLLAQLRDDPEGVEAVLRKYLGAGAEGMELTPAKMREMLRNTKEGFRNTLKAVPQRKAWLDARAKAEPIAKSVHPWLNDAEDERTRLFHQTVSQMPVLKQNPAWDYWLGHAIQGHLNAVAAANKAGAGKGKPAFKLKLKSAMPGTGAAGGAAKAGKMSFAQAKAKGDVAGMASALDL